MLSICGRLEICLKYGGVHMLRRIGLLWCGVFFFVGVQGCLTEQPEEAGQEITTPEVMEASVLEPKDGSVFRVGEAIVFGVEVSTNSGELRTYTWQSDVDGDLAQTTSDKYGEGQVFEQTFDALSVGIHQISLTAIKQGGEPQDLASWTITVNTPPLKPQVNVEPTAPGTADSITVVVVDATAEKEAHDEDFTYSYSWSESGEAKEGLTGLILDSSHTNKGQVWTFTAVANDGHHDGELLSIDISIINTIPNCTAALLEPTEGTTETPFGCSCVERIDPDGDEATDSCRFYHGEELIAEVLPTEGVCALDPTLTAAGMQLSCAYQPADTEAGESAQSEVVVLGNAAPHAPVVQIDPLEGKVEDGFGCVVATESVDPDGDSVTYGYRWSVNEYENDAPTESTVVPAIVDTSIFFAPRS